MLYISRTWYSPKDNFIGYALHIKESNVFEIYISKIRHISHGLIMSLNQMLVFPSASDSKQLVWPWPQGVQPMMPCCHPQAWYHGGWLRVDTHQRRQPQVLQTSTDSLQTQENWDSSQYKDSLPQSSSGLVPWRLAACGHTSKEAATGATNQHW